jgi:adenylate kinase family enzyme
MRITILGNSGSGKSTLARTLAELGGAASLDLDTVAWEPGQIAVARDPAVAAADVAAFCQRHESWVVEGCYAGLVAATFAFRPHLLWLDPGLEACLAHCRARPWEPHKYSSPAEQDARLPFLLDWVAGYYQREGDLSLAGHLACFAAYEGPKEHLQAVPALEPPGAELRAWAR